jgi:hypothetical protein
MAWTKKPNNIGGAAEFAVVTYLLLNNFDANLANPGAKFDIFAVSHDRKQKWLIQVKAHQGNHTIILNDEKPDDLKTGVSWYKPSDNDWYVFAKPIPKNFKFQLYWCAKQTIRDIGGQITLKQIAELNHVTPFYTHNGF